MRSILFVCLISIPFYGMQEHTAKPHRVIPSLCERAYCALLEHSDLPYQSKFYHDNQLENILCFQYMKRKNVSELMRSFTHCSLSLPEAIRNNIVFYIIRFQKKDGISMQGQTVKMYKHILQAISELNTREQNAIWDLVHGKQAKTDTRKIAHTKSIQSRVAFFEQFQKRSG